MAFRSVARGFFWAFFVVWLVLSGLAGSSSLLGWPKETPRNATRKDIDSAMVPSMLVWAAVHYMTKDKKQKMREK